MTKSEFDEYITRCPMLGNPVPFHYCRDNAGALPCRKILDCWHEHFDVHAYLSRTYSDEEMASIVSPPKPKLMQIIEIARKVKEQQS